ncbi:hypothetical protein MKW98_021000 [Papaver atlanticum]|uniref:Chromo shadow domain-containing protein n=1 Tax=Papaver atlanticum TaxID=357466 RepID=A0AAD4XHA4_9MAGN|nr:hypothetical protein MKW98_021000 [Papaver atlanticum]
MRSCCTVYLSSLGYHMRSSIHDCTCLVPINFLVEFYRSKIQTKEIKPRKRLSKQYFIKCYRMADEATASGDHPCSIVKIIKTIGYTESVINDGKRDVHVTFQALCSDGTKVVVDNKHLKVHNPQLLCSFYEQNLRYQFP